MVFQHLQRESVPGDLCLAGMLPLASSHGDHPHPGITHPPRGFQVTLQHYFNHRL